MMGPGFDGRSLSSGSRVGDSSSSTALSGEPGLIPRIMQSLFTQLSMLESDTVEFTVRASYVEIYRQCTHASTQP
jgi:hypothetical protein